MDEAMRLHLWIISRALGVENRKALDVLHNRTHGLNSQILSNRYTAYDQAASKEMELQDAGHPQPVVAMTALRYLVSNKNQTEIVIAMEVQIDIDIIINATRNTRSQFKIKK